MAKDAKGHGSEARGGRSVPDQHQHRIALRTLNMPPAMQGVMGGMNAAEAESLLRSKFGYSDKEIAELKGGGKTPPGSAHTEGISQRLPRGSVAGYAGRDSQGRTYTGAIRDHERFPKQNPTMPNAEDYRTPTKPIPDHPYHGKTDAELNYILRDASSAASAMRGVDAKAEGKYLDQVNDASTVLGYRRRGGR